MTALQKKIEEQLALAEEFQFPYVFVSMPINEAQGLIKMFQATLVPKKENNAPVSF